MSFTFVLVRAHFNSLDHNKTTENSRTQKKAYDLDSKDFFWARNAPNPFPQVAEDIDLELNRSVIEPQEAL